MMVSVVSLAFTCVGPVRASALACALMTADMITTTMSQARFLICEAFYIMEPLRTGNYAGRRFRESIIKEWRNHKCTH